MNLRRLVLVAFVLSSTIAPAMAAVTAERLKQAVAAIDKLAAETVRSDGTPGIAIAVIHANDVVLLKGFGVREMGRPEPVDADTVFQLASMSKPIAATVLARLVGDKVIDWDDRVIDRDPGFRLSDPSITRDLRLRDLLCHRGGLPDHAGDLLEDIGYDRAAILHRLRYLPLANFRAEFKYTNFGYTEAAVAAARTAGKPWEELSAGLLYQPLGMTSTSSRFADFEKARNRAKTHVRVDGRWTAKFVRQPDAQSPAGGVSSTARDLTKWLRLLLADGTFDDQPLIAPEALAETHSPQIVTGFDTTAGRFVSYGLGWIVEMERGGNIFWKHSGEFALGARTEAAVMPGERIAIAVLTNGAPTGVPEAIVETFLDVLVEGKPSRDWLPFTNKLFDEMVEQDRARLADYTRPPADKSPALPPPVYAGKYANEYYGEIEVKMDGATPTLGLGPKLTPYRLKHWTRDTFTYEPAGENAVGTSGVIFTIDPTGEQATHARIEHLDRDGQGTFRRVNQ